MKKKSSSYYPMFLNIRGRKCVVVGGGQVALRKVKTLLAHGALVEVISPELTTELQRLVENGKIALKQRQFQSGDLQGAFIAVAATSDNRTNRKIAGEARESGIPVNVANDTVHSDFIVPSSLSRGDITISVSTSGKSPALARKIRSMLEKELGEEYTLLVELVDEVRTELKKNGLAVDGDRWQEALDLDVLITVLKNEGREKAKTILLNALKMQRK